MSGKLSSHFIPFLFINIFFRMHDSNLNSLDNYIVPDKKLNFKYSFQDVFRLNR